MYGIQINYGTISEPNWSWLAIYKYPGIWKHRSFDDIQAANDWKLIYFPKAVDTSLRILEIPKKEEQ